MSVSADTLLRLVRDAPLPSRLALRVLGLDEWAWRRGVSYGTVLCDLERSRIIDLLPDRQAATVAAWLKAHPGVEIIARGRAGAYVEGIRRGALDALQVADRWHLLCNLSDAVQRVFDRYSHALRQAGQDTRTAISRALPPPEKSARQRPTAAEQRKTQKQARRQGCYEEVARLRVAGQPISQIAHTLGLERKTVRRWLRAGQAPTWHQPPRPSVLDPYRAYLQQRWQEGCRNAAQLWRELCQQGFPGRPSLVRRWAGQRRQLEPAPATAGPAALTWKIPSSRRAPRLVLTKAEFLSEPDHRFVSTLLLANSPDLARVVDLAGRFTRMIQQHEPSELETWLAEAKATELTPFAERLSCDLPAVHAALTLPWSTSPVEGHINRLKTVKRQMYGRVNLDLLRQRLLAA